MTYKPRLIKRSKDIINARNWGIGWITSFLGLGILVSEIQRIKDVIYNPSSIAYLTIFIITGSLVFLWIWATQKELNLCFYWLDPKRYTPPSSLFETIMILGIGVLLSLLFWAARNPLYYSIIFTLYSITVTYTNDYTKREIKKAIDSSKIRIEEDIKDVNLKKKAELYLQGVNTLEIYFDIRPQLQRHLIIIFFCLIGFGTSIYWNVSKQESFKLISYIIFILIIVISEAVISVWRINRDNTLRPIESELEEFKRDDNN